MSMSDLEQACQLIASDPDGYLHGPKSEELVERAERALGLTFPPTYRRFVRQFGCAGLAPDEFYGVLDSDFVNSSVPDAIWMTLWARREANLPVHLIIVSDTGDGGWYAIDLSQSTAGGESPVVEWWPGATRARCIMADDFGAFLLQTVQETQAYRGQEEN